MNKGNGTAFNASDAGDLQELVRSATTRLKAARNDGRPHVATPVLYVLGDENSAKTQTVLQSGLDAQLLSGVVYAGDMVTPTRLTNIWYSASAIVVEAGGGLLRQPGLLQRLVELTQSNHLEAAPANDERQSARAAILCVSVERLASINSAESVRALGLMLNERLRMVSQTLGVSLPVYVLFTKLDTSPSFAEFVANLTDEEALQPMGAFLPGLDAGAEHDIESLRATVAERVDELCYWLTKFRVEILSRGGASEELAKAYEFPREFRKMRSAIIDLLAELGRAPQLGVNHFLRGFYFSGIRARLVDDGVRAPGAAKPTGKAAPDATTIFAISAGQGPLPVPLPKEKRAPQWVFLPQLFPRVILGDSSALDKSRASAKVYSVKGLLIAGVAACLLLYVAALTVSYRHNSQLASRLSAAASIGVPTGNPEEFIASADDLQKLEELRLLFVQIGEFRKHGAPLSYRWGLYNGEQLYNKACAAYAGRFRALLLAPTQARILQHLGTLPATWLPSDDYEDAYDPLRAYLMTTSYPQYSTTDFLPDALQRAWSGNRALSEDVTKLALVQFQTYASTLTERDSCMGIPGGSIADLQVPPELAHARGYLSQAEGVGQTYIRMKSEANRRYPAILFNEKFPGSMRYVVDSYKVDGAFGKAGYTFMQEAVLHPESYASGDEWVVGHQSSGNTDPAALTAQLRAAYLNDFTNSWRNYLKAAHVVGGGNWIDTKERLSQLSGPSSALFELFEVISQNTAVNDPDFSGPFQAPQSVAPGSATALPPTYVAALKSLEERIDTLAVAPDGSTSSGDLQPVVRATDDAIRAVAAIRAGFTTDKATTGIDTASNELLMQPIRFARSLAKSGAK